jgi:thiosulfate/3-mercaptopyruvate sulfurtransferase
MPILDTLVDTQVLASHLDGREWVVVDCRFDLAKPDAGHADYERGHIPGAIYANLDRDLAGQRTGSNGRHPLPDPMEMAQKLGCWGVNSGTQIVAYDAQGGIFAARLWWLARWLGHQNVAVLDGGLQRWTAENRPLSTEIPEARPATFEARSTDGWVDAKFVLENLDRITLLDARAPDRFRGENETLDPVGGRIPGARNRFYRDNLDPTGKFKLPATLKEEFAPLLKGAKQDCIVHSCGSGVSACHNLLAMEIAGMPGSLLYSGSWSEWCSDSRRPVARGNP